MNGNRIKEVKARQVLDSKGRPVVETENIYGKMVRWEGREHPLARLLGRMNRMY